MFKIATSHPLGMRDFPTRAHAVEWAESYGLAPWRVYLNLRKD